MTIGSIYYYICFFNIVFANSSNEDNDTLNQVIIKEDNIINEKELL